MLRDAVPKIRSLGPSFHYCDSRLQVECRDLVGHVGYEQQDSEEEGHLCLQPLKGRLTFTILPVLPFSQCTISSLLPHHILCVWSRDISSGAPSWSPLPLWSPKSCPALACRQWHAARLLVDERLPAGPRCVSAPCPPNTRAPTSPTLGAQTGPRASGGSPQHPPRCHPDAKIIFQVSVLKLITVQKGPTNGPELFQPLTRALLEINHRPTFTIHETFLGLTVKIAWHQKKKRYIKFCSTKNTNFLWL